MIHRSANEPQGKSEGDKESPSRSIKQLSELFKVQKAGQQRSEKSIRSAGGVLVFHLHICYNEQNKRKRY